MASTRGECHPDVIDPLLDGDYSDYEVYCMLHAASLCVQKDPQLRPKESSYGCHTIIKIQEMRSQKRENPVKFFIKPCSTGKVLEEFVKAVALAEFEEVENACRSLLHPNLNGADCNARVHYSRLVPKEIVEEMIAQKKFYGIHGTLQSISYKVSK
ncbi:hypothetical protein L7F22_047422 [Adiantum nelumboides]|nr:hypothetical protein [Adiantum nelumboides]